jgi:predicted DNA-binding transcriptional regulator AlpA
MEHCMASANHAPKKSNTLVTGTTLPVSRRLIKDKEVGHKTGFGKTKRNELIKQGKFPAPIQLPGVTTEKGRTNYWPEDEIDAWILELQNSERQSIRKVADNPLYAWMRNRQISKQGAL